MDLINLIVLFMGDLTMCTFFTYCWRKLSNKNNYKNLYTEIINILIITICINCISYFIEQPVRLIVTYLLLILANHFLYNENLKESIIKVAISECIIWISEFSYVLVFFNLLDDNITKADENPVLYLVVNLYFVVVALLIMKTNIPNKIYNLLNISSNKLRKKESIVYSLMVIIIVIISTIESHMKLPLNIIITTNTIMALFFIFIILSFSKAKNKYNNINNKYQTSITSLKEYEIMIDKFRINTHENKNELLTIRNMVKNKDKKIIEYIDRLIDNKIKDNEKIMYQTSKIPEGGLRATIYSKLCTMDKYKIKYKLDIAKDVRTVDLINLNDELILNICKILGVFFDNAIEAVKDLKEKSINIELYIVENKLYIDITNNYKGDINISKMGYERKTTKGKNHGYGLLLVNKIISDNNRYLENERSINGNQFTQSLTIKMK